MYGVPAREINKGRWGGIPQSEGTYRSLVRKIHVTLNLASALLADPVAIVSHVIDVIVGLGAQG